MRIENISGRLGTLILAGPKAREVLSKVTEADLSNAAFPWLSAREIEIGFARMWALRVNYVGELGWELHLPVEHLVPVYNAIWAAGEAHGIRDFGMYAMDSLRLEKCYRGWKGDITHEYSPLMAGFERLIAFEKPDFIGKQALQREHNSGPKERLVPLVLDEAGTADAPYCSPVFFERGECRHHRFRWLWAYAQKEHRARLSARRCRQTRRVFRDRDSGRASQRQYWLRSAL